MTIINRELFSRDPIDSKIPNDGVARVVKPETAQQWDVLEWELKSFVCEGEYARGLEQILNSFLTNLTKPQQPAVWISGFYGSGKSHLARVLEYLWNDVDLPSGSSSRNLVSLPDEVRDHLTELSMAGKRLGGLWSAAGTLAAGKSDAVRLAFLSVLFESAGLPQQYPFARFMMWVARNGYLDALTSKVKAAGTSLDVEIHDLYVSQTIAEALLDIAPNLGDSAKDVGRALRDQYPPTTTDITDDEMFLTVDQILRLRSTTEGKLPLTLVVLDEMQQYIGDDNQKALAVQNIVEGCSARFKSQILFVATGQSALTATPTLQKLTDRFSVQVALSDKDVESVVRQVILRKKPEMVKDLVTRLDEVSGEINRELGGTQIAAKAEDKQDLVPDYPLLPTRRRFWDLALRAIDRAGKAGVLRTQLKVVHDATRAVAGDRVGHVVGGDLIYDIQSPGMLQSGVLLKEIDELIRTLRGGGPDGVLKARICALIFLISQIPSRTLGGETGLRATSSYLADLLVEDLANDGATLRKRVPELLDSLVTAGRLMRIEDEYRLQTEEGSEWEKDYRSRLAVTRDDASRMSQLRNERLLQAVDQALGGLKLTQGTSKTPRRIDQHWGQDEPSTTDGDVPVWIRDEWSVTEATVKKAAAEVGDESPIVFVFLPKCEVDQIKETLASFTAAQDTLQQRPTPQTDEGKAALRAMKTRVATDEERLVGLFQDVIAHARVFQGGGNEITVSSFRDAIQTAAERSLIRLFANFKDGDNPNWGKIVIKAREGAPDALTAIGHQGEPITHPVCKKVLAAISQGGIKGSDLQKDFSLPSFGWPRDAINGAVLVLLAAGYIRAEQEGRALSGPKELLPTQIGKTTFYQEDPPPTVEQRLQVRKLLTDAGIAYEVNAEGPRIPALLQHLKDLASRAGGDPPLPPPPGTEQIDALQALGGNRQFREVADAHQALGEHLERWQAADDRCAKRQTEWNDLQRLRHHADGLPIAAQVDPAIQAIRDGRQLLDDPDPLRPLLDELSAELRASLISGFEQLTVAQDAAVKELENWPEWAKVDPVDQQQVLKESQLAEITRPEVAGVDQLLAALDSKPLSTWEDRIGMVSGRRDQAWQKVARKLEPESVSVSPPSATLKTEADLDTYLAAVRAEVLPHLRANKTVIV